MLSCFNEFGYRSILETYGEALFLNLFKKKNDINDIKLLKFRMKIGKKKHDTKWFEEPLLNSKSLRYLVRVGRSLKFGW